MDNEFDFAYHGQRRKVYVRSVKNSDLPEDLQIETNGFDKIYAIHSEDGEQLALVKDRELAFAVARTNDFVPESVH
ncbi:DUF1150 family protein [Amylibacter sp. SFDW26]|uniref:DUF1150 family protein n=1 Tax=Amylibacter sp. SFDW26 TaxID=2652722 RepID=UPI0012625C8B|nr:DUF1150 family protein [Amylibacter sp. SFDW26]KAB7610436.1 DUF1150 family protein [Amylibacter sp. SFDW26]